MATNSHGHAQSATSTKNVTDTSNTAVRVVEPYRARRRWPLLLCLAPLVGGLIETNERISDDLEGKARRALGDQLTAVDFDAQDGEICVAGDFAAARATLREVTGVVKVERAGDCEAPPSTGSQPEQTEQTEEAEPTEPPDATEPPTATEPPEATAPEPSPAAVDIVATASAAGTFSTLTELIDAAGLTSTLQGDGPFTVFAPTDEAFAALDPDLLALLQSDDELLAQVLRHHVVAEELASSDLATGELESVAGEPLSLTVADQVTIDAGASSVATVVRPDIVASNGVIHAIDAVLLPPSVREPDTSGSALAASADFDGARITLTGVVDNQAQRQVLVAAATAAVGDDPARVDDQLTIADTPAGAATDAGDDAAQRLAALVATLPANFASGSAAATGTRLSLTGSYLDDAAGTAAEADAAAAGVAPDDVSIEPRPQATEADRDQLIADINALFLDATVQFAPGDSTILPESDPLLDDVAARLRQFDLTGITITIEGHTDSDGSESSNLALSEARAEAVEAALVERGVDGAALEPVGFGESQPIASNDTPENKARNRRVELSAAQ